MTRLKHARPGLKYLDNLRREISRHPSGDWRKTDIGQHQSSPMLFGFDELTSDDQVIFDYCCERYLAHMDAMSAYFGGMADRKTSGKPKRQLAKLRNALAKAKNDFAIAGAIALLSEIRARERGGRGVLTWFEEVHAKLPKEYKSQWGGFVSMLGEDSLDMVVAAILNDNASELVESAGHFSTSLTP